MSILQTKRLRLSGVKSFAKVILLLRPLPLLPSSHFSLSLSALCSFQTPGSRDGLKTRLKPASTMSNQAAWPREGGAANGEAVSEGEMRVQLLI